MQVERTKPEVRVAVVQAQPAAFRRDEGIDRSCELLLKAAEQGAQLVLFPEAYVPAYPRGLSFGTLVGSRSRSGRELWQRYWEQAVEVPSAATEQLAEAVRAASVELAIGVVEKDTNYSRATLYCSLLHFGADGRLRNVHRKLKPTAAERLIWGEGDGSTLNVAETPLGRIGGLICWENMMPLARMALYGQGVEIYLAPTADQREVWQATLRHIALEGRCFVLGSNQYQTRASLPADMRAWDEVAALPETLSRGGSAIYSPLGEILAGPLYDEEGILYATLDRDELTRARYDFDVVGHYARPDVFQLQIHRQVKPPVMFDDDPPA
ncbi:MAG: carbon-nitrogen hydrolase family protein [Anaerolineaceae bacterium]|nr:carbon-nitrogen hydrolase family protein [Anaerolineaceae bacterium]